MTTLAPDQKRRLLHELVRINVWIDNAIRRLRELEAMGELDPATQPIPDFDAEAKRIRDWLYDSIDLKHQLIREQFPRYGTGETAVTFEELYELWENMERDAEVLRRLAALLWGGEDVDASDLDWFEANLRRMAGVLERLLHQPNLDREVRATLEALLRWIRVVRAMLARAIQVRGTGLWPVLRGWIGRTLVYLMSRLRRAWLAFVLSLGTFFHSSLLLLRLLDEELEWVVLSSPIRDLPLIQPSIERLEAANRFKHQLMRLIGDTPTR